MRSGTAILPLTREFAREHADAMLDVGQDVEWDQWTSKELLSELPDKWKLSLVAVDPGDIVTGYVLASAKPHPHVHRLMVSQHRRGEGLGRCLMQLFLERARRFGSEVVSLKTHETNVRSLRLQDGLGFETVARSPTGYIELRKRLG